MTEKLRQAIARILERVTSPAQRDLTHSVLRYCTLCDGKGAGFMPGGNYGRCPTCGGEGFVRCFPSDDN